MFLKHRKRTDHIKTAIYLSGSDKLGKQIKFAEKKDFSIIIICGADELKNNNITLKHLESKTQITIERDKCGSKIKEYL